MHGLSLHNLALDFSDCWQSCAQASKQFSIKSIAAAMDANSEEYATKVWCSNNRALWFLIWLGLLCLPKQCSRGHNWKFSNNQDGAYCHLHCTAKLDEVYPVSDEEAEEEKAPVYKRCNYRKSWRDHGFFHFYLPCSLTPSKYLRALYWFCSDAPQKQILKETGLKVKVWVKIRNVLRSLLWLVMQTHAGRVQLGGQTDRVVVVDETFFTKKKKNTGGFVGRTTLGHKTIVMGFLELQLSTRKATGACVLIEIPNRKQATLKREIQRHVAPGSLIFTDRHKSYNFLSRPNSGFVHRAVNHSRGEFSRTECIFGEDVVVTTNSVEGLFGRLKQYLRQRKYGKVGKPAYGELLAEFTWRQRCSAFRTEPLRNLFGEIQAWQNQHPRRPEAPRYRLVLHPTDCRAVDRLFCRISNSLVGRVSE